MKKLTFKTKLAILTILLLLITVASSMAMLNMSAVRVSSAYNEYAQIEQHLYNSTEIVPLSDSGHIRPIVVPPYPYLFLEDAVYINNAEFFVRNPNHKINNSDKDSPHFVHPFGICTSVAAQLVLSFHNYFTDRRMIPIVCRQTNTRFLHENYGDLGYWPAFTVEPTEHLSLPLCPSIGNTDAMFMDMFNRIFWSPGALLAQTPGYVVTGMARFLIEHYRDINGNRLNGNVNIRYRHATHNTIASRARIEIDAGRPIILGADWTNWSGPIITDPINNIGIHAKVAFGHGYQYVDGVRTHGFIVHYGHQRSNHHVWIPSTSFVYYIRMEVNNITHNFVRQTNVPLVIGNNKQHHTYRCSITGVTQPRAVIAYEQIGNTNNVRVRQGVSHSGHIVIPSTFRVGNNIKTVTEIAASGFANRNSVVNITLPPTVTNIGANAFFNSNVHVTFASGRTQIQPQLLKNQCGVVAVHLPATVTNIGREAFMNMWYLQYVSFANASRLTSIGGLAFYNAVRLTSIAIPEGVRVIPERAFLGARNLIDVTLPNSLTRIGYRAFQDTHNLLHIELPQNLTHIYYRAFQNAFSLQNIVIPLSVINIDAHAFNANHSLTIFSNRVSAHVGWHANFNSSFRPIIWGSRNITVSFVWANANSSVSFGFVAAVPTHYNNHQALAFLQGRNFFGTGHGFQRVGIRAWSMNFNNIGIICVITGEVMVQGPGDYPSYGSWFMHAIGGSFYINGVQLTGSSSSSNYTNDTSLNNNYSSTQYQFNSPRVIYTNIPYLMRNFVLSDDTKCLISEKLSCK